MQPDRVRKDLIAQREVRESKAYILLSWDGKLLWTTESIEIASPEELEQFVLAAAKEGNDFLRRILKHRLENHGNKD